jgi:hypothetical protein
MTSSSNPSPTLSLPVNNDLSKAYSLSVVVAILLTAASLVGLILPSAIYQTDEQLTSFLPNDAINLLLGLPILLVCMWLTKRGKLIGLLCWPGALLYTFYNYIAYIIGMPFGWVSLVFIALVMLCSYLIILLVRNIKWSIVQTSLMGKVSEKFSGGVLVFFGAGFFFLALGVITGANTNQATIPMTDVGVAVADIVLSTLLFVGGIFLFRRKPLGYVSGMGLLFAASALFIGVVLVVLLQPVLTDAPFVLEDVVVLSGMALVCFIPTGLFMRGVLLGSEKPGR